jgi:Tol biopolymer transport system component
VREARAAGTLSHPNIVAVYDFGQEGDTAYIVMEFIRGRTLEAILAESVPHPPEEWSLAILGDVARGLDYAHAHGVFHRDVKPANIMVEEDGGVKIADFGIAKVAWTNTMTLTTTGVVVGSPHYMAPEQLQGEEADARSDIFAFGCVLYELLSGKRAFAGPSVASVIAAILEREPAPLLMAPPLERVIRKCLVKDPDERFQNARDLKYNLALAMEQKPAATVGARSRPWLWIVAGLATAVALAIGAVHFLSGTPPALLTTFTVLPEEKTALAGQVAVSPDGRRIVFTARDSAGNRQLWLRALDSVETRRLPGTEGVQFPAWSPDGRWIGFCDPYQLKKIDVASGQVFTVADAGRMVRGLVWAPDGTIFVGTQGGPIRRVPAAGGEPEPLTVLDRSLGEVEHEYPWLLPGGKRLLFFVHSSQPGTQGIWVASLPKLTDRKRLLADDSVAAYAGGYLLFVRGGALMAQPFDPERAKLSGAPESVESKIGYAPASGDAAFGVSSSGVLAWSPVHSVASKARLTWFDRSGVRLGDVGPAKSYNSVALSPDGKRIVASNLDTNTTFPFLTLLILDLARGTTTDLGRQGASCLYPVWSPDASQIAYGAMRGGVPELFVQSSSGAGEEQGILENGRPKAPTDWSLDGRFLLYRESSDIGRRSLWTLAMKGDRKPERLLPADFSSSNGQFSPDGRWVAYAATESPVQQVYVQSFPPGRGKWQISTDGGGQPRWRHDGKELFYVDPLGKMMSVETKPGATSGPGPPKPLFTFRGSKNPWGTFRYDVTGDGRKFIILTPFEETSFDPLHIVLNWTAGLKK